MNWVLISVLGILLLNIFEGYRKGFLRIVFSLVSWVVVLIFVTWTTPYIGNYLTNNTKLYERIENHFEEKVRDNAQQQTQETIGETDALADLGINLPDNVINNLIGKTTNAADEWLEESGTYTQMAGAMTKFVIEGISFFIALIGAALAVHIIASMLGIVSKIPILKGVNRFLGLFAGAVYGFVIVWIVFYIIALCSSSELGMLLVSYIRENGFLKFLYENNLVLTIILYCF